MKAFLQNDLETDRLGPGTNHKQAQAYYNLCNIPVKIVEIF